MKVLVYEHLTATVPAGVAAGSMEVEGQAMLRSLVASLATVVGVEITVLLHPSRLLDHGLAAEAAPLNGTARQYLASESLNYDAILPVAPETDLVLADICLAVESREGDNRPTLLAPNAQLQRLFADKLATAKRFDAWSIPTRSLADTGQFEPFDLEPVLRFDVDKAAVPPWSRYVVKPRDGAGSQFTAICDEGQIVRWIELARADGCVSELIVQPYWPGLACSVGISPDGVGNAAILPAIEQCLRIENIEPGIDRIVYFGGTTSLDESQCKRVQSLADYLLDSIPDISGYFGIDVVLGDSVHGDHDRIVEVNPRPTTSVVLYGRAFADQFGSLLLQQWNAIDDIGVTRSIQMRKGTRWHLDFPKGFQARLSANPPVDGLSDDWTVGLTG